MSSEISSFLQAQSPYAITQLPHRSCNHQPSTGPLTIPIRKLRPIFPSVSSRLHLADEIIRSFQNRQVNVPP